jgi:hypothetical protein
VEEVVVVVVVSAAVDVVVALVVTVSVTVLVVMLIALELAAVVVADIVDVVGADTEEKPNMPHTATIEVDIASSNSRLKGTPNLVNRRPGRKVPPNHKYFCPNVWANPHQFATS